MKKSSVFSYLLVGELVANVGHEVLELLAGDGAAALLVEDPKCNADQLLVRLVVVHLDRHHVAELGKLYHPGPVSVELKEIRERFKVVQYFDTIF